MPIFVCNLVPHTVYIYVAGSLYLLKKEFIYRQSFESFADLRFGLFGVIEVWYNRNRFYSALEYPTPVEWERLSFGKNDGNIGRLARLEKDFDISRIMAI